MELKRISTWCLALWMLVQLQACGQGAPSSDAASEAIAAKVIANMGGQKGWAKTRYLAWTFNDQYQVWDKQKDRFRLEMDSVVAIINTSTKDGKVYIAGQELQDNAQKQELLDQAYALWINNAYWLVMPFKLQDSGVQLKYLGEGKTMDGAPADMLEMSFENVGLTPQNKYHLWVEKDKELITQWAYFKNYSDEKPTFTRRWGNYRKYGPILLASDRSNPQSDFELFHIAAPKAVPDAVFNSPTPIRKL